MKDGAQGASRLLCVNVGCGATPTPGWVNLDNSPTLALTGRPALTAALARLGLLPEVQRRLIETARRFDVRRADGARLPLADRSVRAVYSSHMFEHLDRREADRFLAEVRRVLVAGGILRLAVPDLALAVGDYLEHKDGDALVERLYMSRPRARGIVGRARQLLVGDRHHLWMYDAGSLCRLLERRGFADAQPMPAGSTTIEEAGELDLYERADESVYVEARAR